MTNRRRRKEKEKHEPEKNRTSAGGIRADPVRQRLLAVFRKKSESRTAKAQTGTTEVQKAFDEFLMEETHRQLTQDALMLHFSLTDPAALGIREKPMTLGSLSEADELRHQQETEAALQNLQKFKPEDLTARPAAPIISCCSAIWNKRQR